MSFDAQASGRRRWIVSRGDRVTGCEQLAGAKYRQVENELQLVPAFRIMLCSFLHQA